MRNGSGFRNGSKEENFCENLKIEKLNSGDRQNSIINSYNTSNSGPR